MDEATTKKCSKCLRDLPADTDHFHRNKRSKDGLYRACKECRNEHDRSYMKDRYKVNRDKVLSDRKTKDWNRWLLVINHYGGKCACCGEDNPMFLTLDHVNGGGSDHRREVGNGRQMLRWVVKNGFPAEFQILCWNCNCGRDRNGGVCPHHSEIRHDQQ